MPRDSVLMPRYSCSCLRSVLMPATRCIYCQRIDLSHTTLPALIGWSVEEHATEDAVIDGAVRMTYAELGDAVDECARAVVASGIGPGDRSPSGPRTPGSGSWPPSPRSAPAACSCPSTPGSRAGGGLRAAAVPARLLFTVTGFLGADYAAMLARHRRGPARPRHVVLGGEAPEGSISWDDFLGRAAGTGPTRCGAAARVGPEDLSLIMFTSGTTGSPRASWCGAAPWSGGSPRTPRRWGSGGASATWSSTPSSTPSASTAASCPASSSAPRSCPSPCSSPRPVLAHVAARAHHRPPGPAGPLPGPAQPPRPRPLRHLVLRRCITGAATIPEEMVVGMRERLGFDMVSPPTA